MNTPIEPIHPTYGTLDQFLATIARDVRQGYEVRIGLQGALNWFVGEYGKIRADQPDGSRSGD